MIIRNERGKLSLNRLDIQIFFDELFSKCQTESEIEWLEDQLQSYIEGAAEESIENL